jgi:hypothetical protein
MKKCDGKPKKAIFLTSYGDEDLKQTIKKNEQEFIDYIHKLGLHVEHNEQTTNYKNTSTTILTLKTTCFKVDFNENLAKIAPLK